MQSWRFIDHGPRDAATNMAIDEALLMSGRPTLRLYTWSPSAVSIGYFQAIREEVNLEACEREGVEVVRRISGGGAVYHDAQGEITYSLVVPEAAVSGTVQDSCAAICSALVAGLREMGVEAVFSPLNDVVVNGKKISGSAQTRRHGVVLQHGTVLVDLDAIRMFSLLRVSAAKIADKGIVAASQRVTSLRAEVGAVDHRTVREALRQGFSRVFKADLPPETLTHEEKERLPGLRDKYASRQWNLQR
ncbi:MAG: lipoate--protein ligase family protein [Thermoplasmatota archaeon]